MTIEEIKGRIIPILERYGIKKAAIFGSLAKGEAKASSDVDILVEFSETISLLDFVAIERELGELLGIKVDLVMKSALKPRIGKHILEEVQYL